MNTIFRNESGMTMLNNFFQKTFPVERATSVLFDGGDVLFCAIPHMSVKTVLRMVLVCAPHERIAMFFCEDRCEGNCRDRFVAFDDGFDPKREQWIGNGDRVDM